jgi:glycosyltransferase involved in cell wall biosynthesis
MELVIHHLANALCEIGCDVTVLAGRVKRVKDSGEFERKYGLVRHGARFLGSGRLGVDSASAIIRLIIEHQRKKFDLLNCHGVSYAASRAVFANKFINLPLVMTPHGEDIQRVPEIGYGLRLQKKWDRIIQSNLSKADVVTAISDSIKNELRFLPGEKIEVIPNGIDLRGFRVAKTNYLHELLKLKQEKKIVLSVGRNHIKKGYEYGIRAFAVLKEKRICDDLVYVIVGRDTRSLEPLLQSHSLRERVYLLPQLDRNATIKCYQSAWCFFSPSIIEGLSLVSIEAMAMGLPLLVTDVPGNIDVVRDNRCGLIARNKDPDSMAEALLSLQSSPRAYQKYSSTALERVINYDWTNIAQKYCDVYCKALGSSQTRKKRSLNQFKVVGSKSPRPLL